MALDTLNDGLQGFSMMREGEVFMGLKQVDSNSLEYLAKYSGDHEKREKLYPLFEKVFGIKADILADFSNRGFWNEGYLPYTFFDGGRAVANVSAIPLPMLINGKTANCMGIQSVMTDPDYRKNGLMKKLFQNMLEDLEQTCEGFMLFTGSPELYTPFGFKVINQYYFKIDYIRESTKHNSLLKLDPLNNSGHLRIVTDAFKNRASLSDKFVPLSYLNSFYFNFYNPWLYEKMNFIEELKIVIVFDVVEGTLRIFDVIGEAIPPLEELIPYISSHFNAIEFYFHPDAFQLVDVETIEYTTENKLMARGPLQLDEQACMMPLTAEF